VPNRGTGKEKKNNSNKKKAPHWHHCWHGAKPLEIVVPSMKNTTIVFLFAAKLRGGCPKLWDRLQLFHFFFEKTPEQSRPACSSYVQSNEK